MAFIRRAAIPVWHRGSEMTLQELDVSNIPRSGLLQVLERGLAAGSLDAAKLAACFDEPMLKDLALLLESYNTVVTSTFEPTVSVPKFKEAVTKVARFTFLSKEALERRIVEPFLLLNAETSDSLNTDEFALQLTRFYYSERLATVKLVEFLIRCSSGTISAEVIAQCRSALKTLKAAGLIEAACRQLVNLSEVSIPTTIAKENRSELIYAWISQNLQEQRAMAQMLHSIFQTDWLEVDAAQKIACSYSLIKQNLGLDQLSRYNLDDALSTVAQEAFWLRMLAATSVFDFKTILDSSASPSQILTRLNPLKPADLLRFFNVFTTNLQDVRCSFFKFAWAVYVGFLDLLEILDNDQLRLEYPKVAALAMEKDCFSTILASASSSLTKHASEPARLAIKSGFKALLLCFFTVFDLERSALQVPVLLECLVAIFEGEPSLCEEFWFVDTQYVGRASILKYLLSKFPHEFLGLIRFLKALTSGKNCTGIVYDLLAAGIDRVFVERSSDRGRVSEEYDLCGEVYNLSVVNRTEVFCNGVSLVLEPGTSGVMTSGFDERPMVHWNVKISAFHFLARVLLVSQDFSVSYPILSLFEALLLTDQSIALKLYSHANSIAPAFSEPKLPSLAAIAVDVICFVLEQSSPDVLILTKALNCLVAMRAWLDAEFFDRLVFSGASIQSGIEVMIKSAIQQLEVSGELAEFLIAAIRFTEMMCAAPMVSELSSTVDLAKTAVFGYIAEHIGRWGMQSHALRLRLVAELCKAALSLEKQTASIEPCFRNTSFFDTILRLLREMQVSPELRGSRIVKPADFGALIVFLMRAIASTSGPESLALAHYFCSAQIAVAADSFVSPFDALADALADRALRLPVLLFWQYIFENEEFALNTRLSKSSVERLSTHIKHMIEGRDLAEGPRRERFAALAVLNNCACTRPDIFCSIVGLFTAEFSKLVAGCLEDKRFDQETVLLTSILSLMWSSVSDFTSFLTLLKKDSVPEKAVELFSVEFPESQSAVAMKSFASVLEVLSVELCYFNAGTKLPVELAAMKELNPEKFIEMLLLFLQFEPEAFVTFAESFALYAHAVFSLKDEPEYGLLLLKALITLQSRIHKDASVPATLHESCCRSINYGLLQLAAGTGPSRTVGFEHFVTLLDSVLSLGKEGSASALESGDWSLLPADAFRLASILLRAESETLSMSRNQIGELVSVLDLVLAILRKRLLLKSGTQSESVRAAFEFLICGLTAYSQAPEMVRYVKESAILRTVFSYIALFLDTEAFGLLLSFVTQKESILRDLIDGDMLESFVETGILLDSSDAFYFKFIQLLVVVKLQYSEMPSISERIVSVLYECNFSGRLERLAKLNTTESQESLKTMLGLIRLLAVNADNPLELRATEAFLASLVQPMLELSMPALSRAVEQATSAEKYDLPASADALLTCLGALNLAAKPNFQLRKSLQAVLYPLLDHETFGSKYSASLFSFVVALTKIKTGSEPMRLCAEATWYLLMFNCPDRMLPKLRESLKPYELLLSQ